MKLYNMYKIIALLIAPFCLTGCPAVALAPMMLVASASGGFALFKTVQMSTGGEVSVSFSEEEFNGITSRELSNISKPALWPLEKIDVYIAETMERSGVFDTVVTPSRVSDALRKLNLDENLDRLTSAEKLNTFKKLCKEIGADSIIAIVSLGSKTSTNYWSFNRANMTHFSEISVYNLKSDGVVYKTVMAVKAEKNMFDAVSSKFTGTNQSNDDYEIIKISAEAVAEKIVSIVRS